MVGTYNTWLVLLSIVVAIFVSYTALSLSARVARKNGVPSKLMIFPDEGHWINKPQNAELWYKTVQDWLAAYLK